MKIILQHVTRIEGHASLTVMLTEGHAHAVRLKYEEGARLFEGLLRGQKFYDAPSIVSRICGVCPSVHNVTALKAIESALDIEPGPVTAKLRRLMILAQWIQSHALHAYFLALPDFLGAESAIALSRTHPEEVAAALELKKLGNDLVRTIGGREIHPITTRIGGFSRVPTPTELTQLKQRLQAALPAAVRLAGLFAAIGVPDFARKTNYLALTAEGEYAYFDGEVCSSEGFCGSVTDFLDMVREVVLPGSAVKAGRIRGKGFFTGSLARMNLNGELLDGEARRVVEESGFSFPSYNTFLNNFCQAVEVVFAIERSAALIDELLEESGPPEDLVKAGGEMESAAASGNTKAVEGTAAIEAPRGTLYHYYRLDTDGVILDDNIITPTAQNLTNIEEDINAFVDARADWDPERLIEGIECLVRAYDPCISCATH